MFSEVLLHFILSSSVIFLYWSYKFFTSEVFLSTSFLASCPRIKFRSICHSIQLSFLWYHYQNGFPGHITCKLLSTVSCNDSGFHFVFCVLACTYSLFLLTLLVHTNNVLKSMVTCVHPAQNWSAAAQRFSRAERNPGEHVFLYFVPSLDTPESEKPVCMKTELVCLNHEVQFGVCF